MPKKSKKVASRQAQLSQRGKRKGHKGPSGIPLQRPVTMPRSAAQTDQAPDSKEALLERDSSPAEIRAPTLVKAEQPRAPVRPAPLPQRTRRGRHPTPVPAHRYVKGELLRIGVLSGIIAVIIVVLTFVLGKS